MTRVNAYKNGRREMQLDVNMSVAEYIDHVIKNAEKLGIENVTCEAKSADDEDSKYSVDYNELHYTVGNDEFTVYVMKYRNSAL